MDPIELLLSRKSHNKLVASAPNNLQVEKMLSAALRAPVILKEHPKVPKIEQILSAGASVQNLIMAAYFQDIGAIWRTGELAKSNSQSEHSAAKRP